ncbi:MAG: cytochrome c biogenesis CcdA family protein [Actinomycetota bacterium]
MSALPLAFAFSAGALASVNPCGFAMLPAFVGYYLGTKDRPEAGTARRVFEGLAIGAAVTAGFVALFAAVGLLVSGAGSALLAQFPVVVLAVGLVLVGLGVWLAAGRPLGFSFGIDVRAGKRRGLAAAAWYGVAYGLASLACTLPVFLVVVGSAFSAGSMIGGLVLFVAYALGMGAVVTAVAVGAALFRGAVARWVRRAIPVVQQLSGALLIAAGTFLVVREFRLARLGGPSWLAWAYAHPGTVGALLLGAAGVATALLWWVAPGGSGGRARTPASPPIQKASRE